MKTIIPLLLLLSQSGCTAVIGVQPPPDQEEAGTSTTLCRPLDQTDAALTPTKLWIAPGDASDWAPCEGMLGTGVAVWCCP